MNPSSARRRRWLLGTVVAAALIGGALLVRLGPALSLALALVRPDAEPWLAPLLDEVSVEETSVTADGRRLVADLYRPSAPRGALLLVHGLSPAGRRHPDQYFFAGYVPSFMKGGSRPTSDSSMISSASL